MSSDGRPRPARSARTATPPATAWCSCRFTLPMPHSKVAEGAAVQLANKMGMDPALVVHAKPMGPDFTFFVVYGRVNHLVDPSKVEVVERDYPLLTPKEANAAIKRALRRRLVVVGGCIGTDAHTVGIDAILNIKGFAGEKGLEYYRELKVVNLGAQVSRARSSSSGPARRRPTPSWSPRSSPSATPTCSTPARCRRRSASPTPPDKRPLLVVGGPALRRDDGRRARRRPRLHPRHDARRGRVVPRPPARATGRRRDAA